jgi:transcriptional regulator with XRE-family HTH domain
MRNPLIKAELQRPGGVTEHLRDARTRANLSGRQLAERAGLRPAKVSKLELGQQTPTAEDVHAWLQACSAGPEEIRRVQAEVDRIRRAYPELQQTHRERNQIASAGALDAAYRRGYAAAIKNALAALEALTPDDDPEVAVDQ